MPILDDAGFSKPTDLDRRCWIWIVTILSVIYSVFFMGARIMAKYGMLWFDDAVLGVAYLAAFAQWGVLMKAIASGLGVSLSQVGWSAREGSISTLLETSRLLWLVSLYTIKASVLVFNRKIFSGNSQREKYGFAVTGAVLATARLALICALDAISEIVLCSLAVLLLAPVNMQADKKRVVILLYSCRFMQYSTTAFFIAQTASQSHFASHNPISISVAPSLILQQITLCAAFVTSTIPCLRSFVGAFNSGGTYGASASMATSSAQKSAGNSYAMTSVAHKSQSRKRGSKAMGDGGLNEMRPDLAQHGIGVSVVHEQGDEASVQSDGSEQMIIRRETRVAVRYDQRTD